MVETQSADSLQHSSPGVGCASRYKYVVFLINGGQSIIITPVPNAKFSIKVILNIIYLIT